MAPNDRYIDVCWVNLQDLTHKCIGSCYIQLCHPEKLGSVERASPVTGRGSCHIYAVQCLCSVHLQASAAAQQEMTYALFEDLCCNRYGGVDRV